jgi:hypothetical protein
VARSDVGGGRPWRANAVPHGSSSFGPKRRGGGVRDRLERDRRGSRTLNDPGSQARRVRSGGDEVGHVQCGLLPEQLQHTSLVPHPHGRRLGEREVGQKAPIDRRTATRPRGTAEVFVPVSSIGSWSKPAPATRSADRKAGSEYSLNHPTPSTPTVSQQQRIPRQLADASARVALLPWRRCSARPVLAPATTPRTRGIAQLRCPGEGAVGDARVRDVGVGALG